MENHRWSAGNEVMKTTPSSKDTMVIHPVDCTDRFDHRLERRYSVSRSLSAPRRRRSNDDYTKEEDQTIFESDGESSACEESTSGTSALTITARSTSITFNFNTRCYSDKTRWSQEETKATWYSKEEYENIHGELDDTAELIATGLLEDPERGGHCLRGLEYKAQDAKERRRRNIRKSQQAVLRIQYQFHRLRICDEKLARNESQGDELGLTENASSTSATDEENEFLSKEDERQVIATAYRKYSFACQMEAQKVGLWDAKEASRLWMEDKCPKPPRRTWAKAG